MRKELENVVVADVFKYSPIIDISADVYVYTNPLHGDSGVENMDISLEDVEVEVVKRIESNPLYRKIIAARIREYADAIERGEIKGYISDYDGYPVSNHTRIEQISWRDVYNKNREE